MKLNSGMMVARVVHLRSKEFFMLNVYEHIGARPNTNKFEFDGLLLAKFSCALSHKCIDLWSPFDQIIYAFSGKKTWRSSRGGVSAAAGQAVFLKKGARVHEQHFDEEFHFMVFFLQDNLIREAVLALGKDGDSGQQNKEDKSAETLLNIDAALAMSFQSIEACFISKEKPHNHLIKLKIKELIAAIVLSKGNQKIAEYLHNLAHSEAPSLEDTMEKNFRKNLTLEQYASLCHRSLSAFKRDFKQQYNSPPGKWLLDKRLEYSVALLQGTNMSLSEVSLDCGFINMSHFSTTFKKRFEMPPSRFRKISNGQMA